MITLSSAAANELTAFFADRPKAGIRVFLAPGGWSGPRLSLALDEPTDNDSSFEANGFTFCIEKDLLERVRGVKIDVSYMGFVVEPELPLANSGSSCGSCGSSCH